MNTRKRWFVVSVLLVLIVILTGGVRQVQSKEEFPTKPIDILVPFAAGGAVDMTARFTGAYLSKNWGITVNVINKPGGNTLPANVDLYNAPPNGYTVLIDGQPSCSTLELVMKKDLPFKVMDRTFLGKVCFGLYQIYVPSAAPYKSLEDLIKDAKENPEKFTWASLGGVSGQDVATRQFIKAIRVDVSKTKPIMCKGGAEAMALVSGGNVKLMAGSLGYAIGPIKAGLIRMLVTTDDKRIPEYPEVPTMAELGYRDVIGNYWMGFSGPPNMPPNIIDIWQRALEKTVKDPSVISQMMRLNNRPSYLNSRDLKEFVRKEMEELRELFATK